MANTAGASSFSSAQDSRHAKLRSVSNGSSERTIESFGVAFDASPNAVLMVDRAGTIVLANEQIEAVFGYTRAKLLGHPVDTLLPKRFQGSHPGHRREFFQNPSTRPMGKGRELFGQRADGSEVPIEIGLNPVITSEGLMTVCVVADITERKEAEKRFAEQTALSRLGQMAAVVAHEVKNPLAGVQGVLQILRTRPGLGDQDRAIIGDVLNRMESLNCLLVDVLTYARPPQLNPASVPVVAFLNGIVTTLSKGEDFAKVAVQIVHEPDDVVLSADRALLERVVINLLVNAVHAVGGDGAVTVSVRKDGDQCEIVFRDNGPGFPEGAEDKVFEPFFTTKSRGTGLGLAICQQVVSLHGGTITAESDATSGAVLTVRLPMESGDPSTPLRSSFYASQKDSQEDPEEGGATRKGQSLTTAAGAGNQSR